MNPKILIVDDHQIIREGLRNLLERKFDTEIIEEAHTGLLAIEKCKQTLFDFVIMDISMPVMNGIEATKKILALSPRTKILTLSMHADKNYIFESLKAGSMAYLLKDCAFEEIISAITATHQGKIFLSAQINSLVVSEFIHQLSGTPNSYHHNLTVRECEVLKLLSEGNSTKAIASSLNLSIKTIEHHRQQIMDKLDLHSIAELTKYAIREGITKL